MYDSMIFPSPLALMHALMVSMSVEKTSAVIRCGEKPVSDPLSASTGQRVGLCCAGRGLVETSRTSGRLLQYRVVHLVEIPVVTLSYLFQMPQ